MRNKTKRNRVHHKISANLECRKYLPRRMLIRTPWTPSNSSKRRSFIIASMESWLKQSLLMILPRSYCHLSWQKKHILRAPNHSKNKTSGHSRIKQVMSRVPRHFSRFSKGISIGSRTRGCLEHGIMILTSGSRTARLQTRPNTSVMDFFSSIRQFLSWQMATRPISSLEYWAEIALKHTWFRFRACSRVLRLFLCSRTKTSSSY